jgi:hypothetical protein
MGILYRVTMEMKRNHIIQELLSKGVKENQQGKSVYDMDYDELKSELVLQAFREIDVENDNNKWF